MSEGKSGSVVVYELHSDGGIGRDKFIFDGKDMYLIGACAIWNTNDTIWIVLLFLMRG